MLCRLSSVVYLVKLWSPDEGCGGVLSCCRFLGFRSVMDQSFLHSRSTLSPAVRGSRGCGGGDSWLLRPDLVSLVPRVSFSAWLVCFRASLMSLSVE
ncbi:hypothetical protein Bca101_029430 [Brassica carinata]